MKNEKVHKFLKDGAGLDVEDDVFLSEFEKPFGEYLRYGSYPEVIKSEEEEMKKTVLKNLFETYITRDIISLLKVQESAKLREVVKILSSQLGGLLNYNNISESCDLYMRQALGRV